MASQNDRRTLYFVARKDLRLSAAKLSVQCVHALEALMLRPSAPTTPSSPAASNYMSDPKRPAIVLRVKSETALQNAVKAAQAAGLPAALQEDAGSTEVEPGTPTVMAVGPCFRSELPPYIDKLQTYQEAS